MHGIEIDGEKWRGGLCSAINALTNKKKKKSKKLVQRKLRYYNVVHMA